MNWLREPSAQRIESTAWQRPAAVIEETDGRRGADFEVGDRSENTFERLYARLPEAQQYCSARDAVYAAWFPTDCHKIGRGGSVNWNEGLHSVLRSQLNRLARRTKESDKSIGILVYSVVLVCQRMGAKSITPAR